MKTTGAVLIPRRYNTSVAPPAVVLEDTSRFKNDGTFLVAGEPAWVRLPSGLWINTFDGIDDRISIPHSESLNIKGDLTILAWVKLIADENGAIIDKNYIAGGYMLWVESLASGFHVYVNNAQKAISSAAVLLNTWYHLVATITATTVNLYQNSVNQNTLAGGTPTGNVNDVFIGRDIAGRYINANLLLPILLNYALSAASVWKIFQAERRWFGV